MNGLAPPNGCTIGRKRRELHARPSETHARRLSAASWCYTASNICGSLLVRGPGNSQCWRTFRKSYPYIGDPARSYGALFDIDCAERLLDEELIEHIALKHIRRLHSKPRTQFARHAFGGSSADELPFYSAGSHKSV